MMKIRTSGIEWKSLSESQKYIPSTFLYDFNMQTTYSLSISLTLQFHQLPLSGSLSLSWTTKFCLYHLIPNSFASHAIFSVSLSLFISFLFPFYPSSVLFSSSLPPISLFLSLNFWYFSSVFQNFYGGAYTRI